MSRCLLSIWRELNVSHRLLEVEVVQDDRPLEVDEQSSAVWRYTERTQSICSTEQASEMVSPSSALIRLDESGLSAILAMFLRFSAANVLDLLLQEQATGQLFWYNRSAAALAGLLDEVKDRHSVANRADDRVAIWREQDVALLID